MNLKIFFGELKRRNVYKVAVAYAVVGWLLIQVATQVFSVLGNSELAVHLACAMIRPARTCSPNSVYPQHHEWKTFFVLGAKAAQRFSGCTDLCRSGVAAD
jgi:hypothetical protein